MTDPRLDLDDPAVKKTANEALPALFLLGAMGNPQASKLAGQVIGRAIEDAMRPSFEALARLRQGVLS